MTMCKSFFLFIVILFQIWRTNLDSKAILLNSWLERLPLKKVGSLKKNYDAPASGWKDEGSYIGNFLFLFNVKVSHFLSNVRVSADTEAIILEYSLEFIYSLPNTCEWVNYISCWLAEDGGRGREVRQRAYIYICILVYSKSCFDSPLLKHLHLKSNSLLKIQNQNHSNSNKTEGEKTVLLWFWYVALH